MIDNAPARGTCTLCGEAIGSATALYCVACLRAHTISCPECVKPDGKLVAKYNQHQGHPTRECTRCGEQHTEDRRLRCATCNNDRVIFQVPEEAKK